MGQYASYTAAFKLKAAEYLRPSGMANVLLVVTSALTRFVSCTGETSSCQWLQFAYEVINFHCFVTRICEEKGFLLLRIRNADQTPLNVNMPRSTTVKHKGAPNVPIHTSGKPASLMIDPNPNWAPSRLLEHSNGAGLGIKSTAWYKRAKDQPVK
ncbi:hypothetical protein HPB49_001799 [Dermacentor silvarum]|uniref:Uncharacterized protein n=1 Tax=Dermacentor silvarum TaxID=543639 RepID=A0ACB8CP01_DERSI|nr:hypothetical protein HPB49_001799 [Dermacentor silvarum]